MSRLALFFAFAFGVLAPYRAAAPQSASEEVEVAGDRGEAEESAQTRLVARHGRRGERHVGPSTAEITFARVPVQLTVTTGRMPTPRWLRPHRVPSPDEESLARA